MEGSVPRDALLRQGTSPTVREARKGPVREPALTVGLMPASAEVKTNDNVRIDTRAQP